MPGFARRARLRTRGEPRSANGASSFHLRWLLPPCPPLTGVAVDLEVRMPPAVDRLYFWALQVTFADGGGAHVGLQWNPRHPGCAAVNWGGYAPGGGLLDGTASALPSAPGDPNTRDYPWVPGATYRLAVGPAPGRAGWWRGSVTDVASGRTTVVRDLAGGGGELRCPTVWSEVFARCDHPSVAARWSGFEAVTAGGDVVRPDALAVSYEPGPAGGCDNTTVAADAGGVLQVTNAGRAVPHGGVVRLTR